jgi:hypothetical protein
MCAQNDHYGSHKAALLTGPAPARPVPARSASGGGAKLVQLGTIRSMATDPNTALVETLERFLRQSKEALEEELNRDVPLPLTPRLLAERLAELPACREADSIAHETAATNRYAVSSRRLPTLSKAADEGDGPADASAGTSSPSGKDSQPAGRPLDWETIVSTGILGLLQSRAPHDLRAVAIELAGYLAGPPTDIWDYAILDGNLSTDDPIRVIDGWELVTLTVEELRHLLPLPATASYQPDRPFALQDYAGLTMLRRVRPGARPLHAPPLRWDVLYSQALDRPAYPLWRPLLALSLFENSVLQLWARYQVEPARRTDKLFDDVVWEVRAIDADTDYEQPMTGSFGERADVPVMQRFLAEIAPRMPEDLSNASDKKETKAAARLRRCAEHFITAGSHAHGEGEVLSELNADAVLHYVIALEGLLSGDSEDHGELTRKISQRAAILAGTDAASRLQIDRLVRGAYDARSKYAHGTTPKKEIDLPALRRVVRDCVLTRLVVGDATTEGPLHETADHALLSNDILERCIRKPIDLFRERVRG